GRVEAIRRNSEAGEAGNRQIETLLDERDVARWIRVSAATLRYWRGEGKGPRYRKVGQLVRYAPSDVQDWLNSRPAGGECVAEEASRA
ncbi:MAG: helix-turn-helix transcriptional regulator, partial [Bryobacteraceae bacterium]